MLPYDQYCEQNPLDCLPEKPQNENSRYKAHDADRERNDAGEQLHLSFLEVRTFGYVGSFERE